MNELQYFDYFNLLDSTFYFHSIIQTFSHTLYMIIIYKSNMSCTAYIHLPIFQKKLQITNNLNMYFLITLLKAGKYQSRYHANMKNIHWK